MASPDVPTSTRGCSEKVPSTVTAAPPAWSTRLGLSDVTRKSPTPG